MDIKKYSIILYNSLNYHKIKNKMDIITNLFKINKSTFYKWNNNYKECILNNQNFYDFIFSNVTNVMVDYIVSYVATNLNVRVKKIKKNINKIIPDNKLSYKQISIIINKNNCFYKKYNKRGNYKINEEIEKFIMIQINTNNTLTAKEIIKLIEVKFLIDISLTSIYNVLQKNNFTYKNTTLNIKH
jgi:transposase